MIDREQVLLFFRDKTRRPLSFREMAALMGLRAAEGRALKKVLRRMVRNGELVRTRRGLYGPAEEMELVTGYFEAHGDGYGFVVQEKPGRRDLFIPVKATLSAMDNDRVVAREEDPRRRKGRIIRILERAHARIVGTVDVERGVCYVKPKSKAIQFDIYIPPKCRGGARRGQRVLVEITEYPTGKRSAVGCVLKALPRPEDPRAEVESVIEEFSLPKRFPRHVLAEAGRQREKRFGKRKDLTGLHTVTIDGERARDFDDAVSIRLDEHGYTLWVHIADVGFYVGWDSPLDLEARKRATSVYFPDRVIPMLPKDLSEDLCSLRPGVQRPAFTVQMSFDRNGGMTDAAFYPSLIRSNERMTYTSVRKILVDEDERERAKYDYLLQDFDFMRDLAGILRNRRMERGSLDFDLPEPEVLLDVQCRPEAILRAERNLAHIIVEEFMIAANEAVAGHLEGMGVPSLYRIHEEPDPRKVEEIVRVARPPIAGRKTGPGDLHSLLKAVKGKREEEVVTYLVLRALKQARYSPDNVGHFGLASGSYTHFTSPIRRYPDLVVHRILREVLLKKRLPEKRLEALGSALPDIAFNSSRRERAAEAAERDVVDAMRMWFMRDKVGEEFDGKVVGVASYGVRVRLNDFYVDGFLHMSCLTDDFYVFDEPAMTLRGRHTGRTFALGQALRVRVDRVDIEEREIAFGTVSH
jgi:ribonuclease R